MIFDEVRQELKTIFRKIAPEIEFDEIDLDRPLRDQVEIDSLDFYNILVQIEKNLGVNIPESVVIELQDLGKLIRYIEKHHS
jgi:acyl carrier protein